MTKNQQYINYFLAPVSYTHLDVYKRQWQNPEKELAKVFLVKYKGKIIGGSICLFSKESAYLWFSGGMRKTLSLIHI